MIINKDERVRTSSPYLGFLVLKKLHRAKDQKLMFDEIVAGLKKEAGTINYRQIIFTMIFLYQAGVIEFAEPYVYKK